MLKFTHENFGHTNFQKNLNITCSNYYSPNMTHDTTQYVKHCDICHNKS